MRRLREGRIEEATGKETTGKETTGKETTGTETTGKKTTQQVSTRLVTSSNNRANQPYMRSLLILMTAMTMSYYGSAQGTQHYVRIARLTIDSSKLSEYRIALAEHARTAVSVEKGVLMLYAVYEKEQPTHVTVFEIYANEEAYQAHIKTPHFLKYKATVKDMVKSLELVDAVPIALESKSRLKG